MTLNSMLIKLFSVLHILLML